MRCPHCQAENLSDSLYCEACGGALEGACPACGADNRPTANFCRKCRAPLRAEKRFTTRPEDGTEAAEVAVARKVVTIVFADLVGSTSLHERLDAESVRHLMDRYYRALRAAVETHGGTVVKLLGDGVMAAFGVPRVAEDDAIRAVRAALDMQRAVHQLVHAPAGPAGEIGLRVAVNTGEVVVSADHTDVVGDPVNVAARLQQEAHDGDVLIGESTRRLISELVTLAPVGVLSLKGRSETVTAYRVVSLDRPAGMAATTPLVGRDDELRRIAAVYDTVVSQRRARLAVILGSPGLGKSRLLGEFTRRIGDGATVLIAHCDPAGGATFAPLAEALRVLLRIDEGVTGDALRAALDAVVRGDESERGRIAAGIAALLAGTPASPEETFFVVRRLLAAFAAAHAAAPEAAPGIRPVVLAIDDLQWAEPLLLDLTEHLVQWSPDVPLLVLAAARPELREVRSSLVTPGSLVADVVTLGGLDAAAATRLAANVIGADALPAAVAGRVLATSEGNPLFVAELVRMLVHDGVLKQEGDRWTIGVELAALEMPPTIHAVLAARIERLRPDERTVLERAAVVGRHFSRAAVAHLLPREMTDLDARLESLRRSELIEPDTGWFLGEPVLRFHHVLIRDAAYRCLLKGTRAELHSRFAEWLETRVGESVEHEETIGRHLEQAHQLLRELGPIDAPGRALGDRAAHFLAAAGRRALARDDVPVAAGLLGRALESLARTDAARADLALDWCEALLAAGDVGPAAKAVAELGRFVEDRGLGGYGVTGLGVKPGSSVTPNPLTPNPRLAAWHTCFAGQLAVLTDPQTLRATADAVAAAADDLAAAGDAAGEAKAHSVHAMALARLGKIGASEAALDRALAAARRVSDRRRSNAVLAGAPLAALWGPSPVTRASGRCLDVVRVLRITQGAPAVEAVALRCQGVLEALRGRTEAARRMIASSRRMVEELGITQRLLEADVFAGHIELLEGNAVDAERCLRAAYDGLREHGLGIDAAQAAALLGRALLAQGRAAEAEALSHESQALAGDDFKAAIAWRGVRAEALARRGEHAPAIDLARAAVDIAAATDALLDHADARLALAVALHADGRDQDARAEEMRAIELWEAKGATLLAERARRDVGPVGDADRTPEHRVEAAPAVRRRIQSNAATAEAARLEAAVTARDDDALVASFSDLVEIVEHATGAVFDGHGMLTMWRALLRAQEPRFRYEVLATLGDALALGRSSMSFGSLAEDEVAPFGAVTREEIGLLEVGVNGRHRRLETFAPDHLSDAVARLYERHADLLADGPARVRATATARAVAALLGPPDVDRYATAFAPDTAFADHRTGGFKPGRGRERLLRGFRSLFDLATNIATCVDDIFCVRADTLLVRWTTSGTDRTSGGAFESHFLALFVFGTDGLVAHEDTFDADREGEALTRFDELTGASSAARVAVAWSHDVASVDRRVLGNAATANAARMDAAVAARDIDAIFVTFADGADSVHHPTGTVHTEREAWRAYEVLLGAKDLTFRHEPMVILGESLALCRGNLSFGTVDQGGELFGAANMDSIVLIEVDARGQRRHTEFFATDRLGDAVARLYERYADVLPEGPARVRAVAAARSVASMMEPFDPDRVAKAVVPAVELVDHRSVGFGSSRGVDDMMRAIATAFEVADDLTELCDAVIAAQPNALLVGWMTSGRNRVGGGTFEWPHFRLGILGVDGCFTRLEIFGADREHEALARFDALATTIENAATRCMERFVRAWDARDWDIASRYAPGFRLTDRRTIVYLDLDADEHLRGLRPMFDMESSRFTLAPFATRGDRLALARARFESSGGAIGPSESEWLQIIGVDDRGDCVAMVMFDCDDLDAAYAELDERYVVGEGGPYRDLLANWRAFRQASDACEWETVRCLLPDDFTMLSHRRLANTGSRMSRDEFITSLSWGDDRGVRSAVRRDHLPRLSARAAVEVVTLRGSLDGGDFEQQFILVITHDGSRFRAFEAFDLDQLDAALTRYEEVSKESPALAGIESAATRMGEQFNEARARFAATGATGADDPLRVPPNAATRAIDRLVECGDAKDWAALEALCAPTCMFEDRRRHTLVAGDRDLFITSSRLIALSGARPARTLLATSGDRLALEHVRWTGPDEQAVFEIEALSLMEVDAEGRIVAAIAFEPDDRRAASVEMFERYVRSDAGGWMAPRGVEFRRALAAHDLGRVRAALPDDFFFHDHRRTGAGRIEGADAYVAWLGTLFEQLSPDALIEPLYYVAAEECGFLAIGHMFGTTTTGGDFESVFVQLGLSQGVEIIGAELFEPEDLEIARTRFEALRRPISDPRRTGPDPLRIPPNAATQAGDRWLAYIAARDWDALRTLCAPIVYDDRRRHILVTGDCDVAVSDSQLIAQIGARASRTLLATSGERLALERIVWSADETEIEVLALFEVDAAAHIIALIIFDPDDRRAASAEMFERYARSAAGKSIPTAAFAGIRAMNDHDLERFRAVVPDDFVLHDHRRTGVGRLEGADASIASLAALLEQAPDLTIETLYTVATEQHGELVMAHMFGTLAGGGEFESVYARLGLYRGDRIVALELFEPEHLDIARARLEELRPPSVSGTPQTRPDPFHIPPNARRG